MLSFKKRDDHAEDGEDGDGGIGQLDFAWIVFMGIQMGYPEKEIAHMYLGKWMEMFDQFKKFYNFKAKRGLFKEEKVVSLLDL